jgi:hypothetical protein
MVAENTSAYVTTKGKYNHHCLVNKFNRRTYKCNLAALFLVIIRLNWMMTVRVIFYVEYLIDAMRFSFKGYICTQR